MKYTLILGLVISLAYLVSAQQYVLDANYGENGILFHDKYNGQVGGGQSILLQDGSLLLMGRNNIRGLNIQMLRILPDGTCDPLFGEGGIVDIFANVTYRAAALQSDGKIVGVGYRSQGGTRKTSAFRLNADGSWDRSFGNNGSMVFENAGTSATDIYIDASDQIYLTDRSYLMRLTKDGALDPEFGQEGRMFLPSSSIVSVGQRSNGEIIVAGQYLNSKIYYQQIGTSGDTLASKVVYGTTESVRDSVSFIKVLDDDAVLIGGAMVVDGIKQTGLLKYSADDDLLFDRTLDLRSQNWMTDLDIKTDGTIVGVSNLREDFKFKAVLSHFDEDGGNLVAQDLEELELRDIFAEQAISSCHIVDDHILISGLSATATFSVDFYTSRIVDLDLVSSAFDNEAIVQFELFPSPSDGSFGIEFNLLEAQSLDISLVDLTGGQVDVLAKNVRCNAGVHSFQYETDIVPGQYYLTILNSEGEKLTRQLIIAR